jgi:hypothetical protein
LTTLAFDLMLRRRQRSGGRLAVERTRPPTLPWCCLRWTASAFAVHGAKRYNSANSYNAKHHDQGRRLGYLHLLE